MHSTSNTTCSDSTSATLRGSVMTSSGRTTRPMRPPTDQAVNNGTLSPSVAGWSHVNSRPRPRHGSSGWGEAPLVLAAQVHVEAASAAEADQHVRRALACVSRGERNGPRDLVAGSGGHGELATADGAGEPGYAKVAPAHGDPLGRSRPDLHRDAARAGDVALHRAGHELPLGGARANAQRPRPAVRAGCGLRRGDPAGSDQYRACRNDGD